MRLTPWSARPPIQLELPYRKPLNRVLAAAIKLRHCTGGRLEELAEKLNETGYRTTRGEEWDLVSVSQLLSRDNEVP